MIIWYMYSYILIIDWSKNSHRVYFVENRGLPPEDVIGVQEAFQREHS
jgi:hypothetical protein